MVKLLKIGSLKQFNDSVELFKIIAESTTYLIYYGGEVINPHKEYNIKMTIEKFYESGARLFTSRGTYSKIEEFEYIVINLEGFLNKKYHDYEELSQIIEELI